MALPAVYSRAGGVLSDVAAPLYLHGICVNHEGTDGEIVTDSWSPLRSTNPLHYWPYCRKHPAGVGHPTAIAQSLCLQNI